MKRIVFFAGFFHPHVGGSEKALYELCKRLAHRGYEVHVLACNTSHGATRETVDGFHIYRVPSWNLLGGTYPAPKPLPLTLKLLREVWKKGKVDLVATTTRFYPAALIASLFATAKRAPLVYIEMGSTHSVVSNKIVSAGAKTYDHVVGWMIVKHAKRNTGVSQAACDFLKHIGAKNPIRIPNGIDTEVYKKVPTDLKSRLGLDGATVMVFVGRLIWGKGVQDVITVFPELKEKYAKTKFVVVGDGSYRDELVGMAKKVGDGDILFLGEKQQDDVIEILSIADLFVNPSYSEGLPTSVMEAAALGIPIVATDVGGTKEIIEDGKSGFVVPAGDTAMLGQRIGQMLGSAQLRNEMAVGLRESIIEHFGWESIADRWEEYIIPK